MQWKRKLHASPTDVVCRIVLRRANVDANLLPLSIDGSGSITVRTARKPSNPAR